MDWTTEEIEKFEDLNNEVLYEMCFPQDSDEIVSFPFDSMHERTDSCSELAMTSHRFSIRKACIFEMF